MIVIGGGVVLFCLIYFFGNTIPPKEKTAASTADTTQTSPSKVDIKSVLAASKQQLTPDQQAKLAQMEESVVRGDVKDQQIKNYKALASYWKDSLHLLLPYFYYTAEASKLENSEKSLTFAAHYFLVELRRVESADIKNWMAGEAKVLFEKALAINPQNDSSKIGLGSCYLFGAISATPMEGIQLISEVANRDSTNMFAQFMLGLGGYQSGQYEKAIVRLKKVVDKEPSNLEAILALAESYERSGDKANAIQWYEKSKKFFDQPEIVKEIDARIALLKK